MTYEELHAQAHGRGGVITGAGVVVYDGSGSQVGFLRAAELDFGSFLARADGDGPDGRGVIVWNGGGTPLGFVRV